MPGSAQAVLRVQSASERWPFQATFTVVGTSLRTTTTCLGTAPGHSWVDQIRSSPRGHLDGQRVGETVQLHAAEVLVVSTIENTTGRPAYAGRPAASGWPRCRARAVPGRWASTVGAADAVPAPVAAGLAGRVVGVAVVVDGVPVVLTSAPTGCAEGPLPAAAAAEQVGDTEDQRERDATRISRRVQYTRAGSGPRGRVTVVMRSR